MTTMMAIDKANASGLFYTKVNGRSSQFQHHRQLQVHFCRHATNLINILKANFFIYCIYIYIQVKKVT